MRFIAAIFIAIASIVGIVYIAGRTQPEQHMVTQSDIIAAPPDAVWARMTDVQNEPKWRKSVTSITLDAAQDGMPCYTEQVGLAMKLCVERTDGQRLRRVSVHDTREQFNGTWTFLVQPGDATQPNGQTTRLTVTEDATIHPALWRGVMLILGTDRNVKQYLKDMSRSFSGRPEQT